jgi:hypothetical protein
MFVSQQPNVGIAITALAVRDYLDGALPTGIRASTTVTPEKPATKLAATDTPRVSSSTIRSPFTRCSAVQ